MIMDAQNLFSALQAVTVTAVSTNVIDLGVDRDVGGGLGGRDLEIDTRVVTAFTAAGAATLVMALQTATDAAFTAPIILAQTDAIPVASLVAGYEPARFRVMSPTKRYLRLNYTVATGPMTAGTINAAIVADRQANRTYPSGIPAQS